MEPTPARTGTGRRIGLFAIAVVVGHHLGTILKPLGTVGPTEWADWVDLVVPTAVLGSAAAVLLAVGTTRARWVLFAAGALAYTQGHGIHLGANSISNAEPTGEALDAAHLWDEVVSHHIWYAGLALVVLSLALSLFDTGQPERVTVPGYVAAALFGLTWTTNAIEGGTVVLSAASAAAFVALAVSRRQAPAARVLLVAYGLCLLLLLIFGVWHSGFPQFSELGWI
jgi:hypothetical protein